VEVREAASRGVEARVVRVRFVRTGVRWMRGRIRAWASMTEARVRGGQVERSAMAAVVW
jgi:hypothetical protein